MKLTLAIVILGLLGLVAPSALAQSAGGNAADIRDLLLRSTGWIYDWKPSLTSNIDPKTPGEVGNGEMLFQMRGDAIALTIHNLTRSVTCERTAAVSADTVVFDACFETGIRLRFDPADREFSFKGGNTMHDYRLKAK